MNTDTNALVRIDLDLLESTLATFPPETASDHLTTDHCTVANALYALIDPLPIGQTMLCGYEVTKIKTIGTPYERVIRRIAHSPGVERFIRETDGCVHDGTHDQNYTAQEAIEIIRKMKGLGYS